MSLGISHFPEGQSAATSFDLVERSRAAAAPYVAPSGVQSPPPLVLPPQNGNGDLTPESFFIQVHSTEWTKSNEMSFSKLAALKALGKASSEELATLNELQIRRRKGRNPMAGDEVLFQYQRRQMEIELLKNLQQYVQFLEAPRRS